MKTSLISLTRIGKSRGVCLPAEMIRRHGLEKGVVLEDRGHEIILRSGGDPPKLTWEETYREMAAAGEDWSEWDVVLSDGLNDTNEWSIPTPALARKVRRSNG